MRLVIVLILFYIVHISLSLNPHTSHTHRIHPTLNKLPLKESNERTLTLQTTHDQQEQQEQQDQQGQKGQKGQEEQQELNLLRFKRTDVNIKDKLNDQNKLEDQLKHSLSHSLSHTLSHTLSHSLLHFLSPQIPDYVNTPEFKQDVKMATFSESIYSSCPSLDYCIEDAGGLRVGIHKLDNKCYVIFRGTASFDNVVTDVSSWMVPNPMGPGRLHAGFAKATKAVKDNSIYKTGLQSCINDQATFYFTGHSLGGAVASLAIYYFHMENNGKGLSYRFATFGSPRVGDADFRNHAMAPSILGGKGARYEAVQTDEVTGIFFKSHTSPPGDNAKPGDIIPRLPPITPIPLKAMALAAWAAKFVDPAFWLLEEASTWLGTSAAADGDGFRHIGKRYQVTCDLAPKACHSMKNVYLPRIKANDIRDV